MFPTKRLVPINSMPAKSFMNAVGSTIFPGSWTATDMNAPISEEYPYWLGDSDTPENRKTFVQHQILTALADGLITAEIDIVENVAEIHHQLWQTRHASAVFSQKYPKAPSEDEIAKSYDFDTSEESEEIEDDVTVATSFQEGTPTPEVQIAADPQEVEFELYMELRRYFASKPTRFRPSILASWWKSHLAKPRIDWTRSVVELPSGVLMFDEAGTQKTNLLWQQVTADAIGWRKEQQAFFIRNAERAIMTVGEPHPEGVKGHWRTEYPQQDKWFWPEVIAAAWRIIAIKGLTSSHGNGIIVVEELRSFFSQAGFDEEERKGGGNQMPSVATLNKLVGEIFDQMKRRELTTPVLVNTGTYVKKL